MTAQMTRLQGLNELLTEYAKSLTPEASSPRDMEALRQIYHLQSMTTSKIHALLATGALDVALSEPSRNEDGLLRPFADAIARSRSHGVDIAEVLTNPIFTEHFERLYTILGPNHGFPDDDAPVVKPGQPKP